MKSQKLFAIYSFMIEMLQAKSYHWFFLFNPLTLAYLPLDAVYDNPNSVLENYRAGDRMVLAAEGCMANDTNATSKHTFCNPTYVTANYHLHSNAWHFMSTVHPGSDDPHFILLSRPRLHLHSLHITNPI